jgi:hypothetical protein
MCLKQLQKVFSVLPADMSLSRYDATNCLKFVNLVFSHKDTVLMLSLVLSIGDQPKADSACIIYVYRLY